MIGGAPQGTAMDCGEARQRLVALQDGELAPSEQVQVEEHLASCPSCRALEARLAAVTPRASLQVPPAMLARLEDRVATDVILALADRSANRPHPTWIARAGRWLRRDLEIPAGAVVGYLVLLAATLGWAVASWWSLQSQPSLDVASDAPGVGSEIPAEQWRPAAYSPEADEGVH
jgi:predicted anti-sigma-YlaC factor YlaD